MNIEVNDWTTPNFVTAKMPSVKRQEGFVDPPKWSLSEVDVQTLSDLCDRYREEIFRKAGKPDPRADDLK